MPSTTICPSCNWKTPWPLNQAFAKLLPLTTVNWLYEVPMQLRVLASRIGLRVYSSSPIESRNRFDRGSSLGELGVVSRKCRLPLLVASRNVSVGADVRGPALEPQAIQLSEHRQPSQHEPLFLGHLVGYEAPNRAQTLLAVHDFQYAIRRFREVHDRNWNVQKKRFDESAGLALVPHVLALVTEFEKRSFGV